MSNIISQVEQGLFKYQDWLDGKVASAFHSKPNDVAVSDRSAFLLASVAAVLPFGCDFVKEESENKTESNGTEMPGLCETHNCGNKGTCYENDDTYFCDCDNGYQFKAGTCFPIKKGITPNKDTVESADTISSPIGDKDTFQGEDTSKNQDSPSNSYITDPIERCKLFGESNCLSYNTALFCYPFAEMGGYHYKTVDCPDGQHCYEGKCVTNPDTTDSNCGPESVAECTVTDEVDFVEDSVSSDVVHELDYNGIYGSTFFNSGYLCGEDDAFLINGIYWASINSYLSPEPTLGEYIAFSMKIDVPPYGSYYRLDLKHDTFYYEEEDDTEYWDVDKCDAPLFNTQILSIAFGDEQIKEVPKPLLGEECIYQSVATFSTSGIDADMVRIQFQNLAAHCYSKDIIDIENFIAVAKTRIWSCKCK